MRLLGHGHPEIRATHGKSFELVPAAEITGRATCVIAVEARPDGAAGPLAGPLRLEIRAGGQHAVVRAVGNPGWAPGGSAVIRRSAVRLPGTLATEADTAAADLPADLVAALRQPATAVELSISQDRVRPDGRAELVLLWIPAAGVSPRLPVELAAAGLVVAEDSGARRLLADSPAPTNERVETNRMAEPGDTARIAATVTAGGRLLVVSTEDLPGASVPGLLTEPATVAVEVAGLPGPLAVAAASSSRAPLVLAGAAPDLAGLLRQTPAGHRLVVEIPAARLPKLLELAAERRGCRSAVLARQPYWQYERPHRIRLDPPGIRLDSPAQLPTHGTVVICLEPAGTEPAGTEPTTFDPAVRAMLASLLADQIPTRTAARALAELTGWPHRQAYQAVLDLAGPDPTYPI